MQRGVVHLGLATNAWDTGCDAGAQQCRASPLSRLCGHGNDISVAQDNVQLFRDSRVDIFCGARVAASVHGTKTGNHVPIFEGPTKW